MLFFLILVSGILTACYNNAQQNNSEAEITAAAAKIYRACKYQNGSFCDAKCCPAAEICGNAEAYRECDLETGEWAGFYADYECSTQCESEIKSSGEISKGNCTAGWKCVNESTTAYQSSDCSWSSQQNCKMGCENGACKLLCRPNSLACDEGNNSRICTDEGDYRRINKECDHGCIDGICIEINETISNNTYNITANNTINETIENNSSQTDYISAVVIDGDTIKLDSGETVRLIGINTPEQGEPYYEEAKSWLKEKIEGKSFGLESDKEDKDQYGRLLRYLILNNENINVEIVKNGYATVYVINPNDKYEDELKEAWEQCLENKINLCKPADQTQNSCANCISVDVNEDAEGDDCDNLNGEYVIFTNSCQYSCDLSGWTVKDLTSRDPFTFSNFNLNKGQNVKLYTGCGSNSATELYWCSKGYSCNAIWNNNGDTLFLRNEKNELVLEHKYT